MRNRVFITAPAGSDLRNVEGSWSPSVIQLLKARRDPIGFGEQRRARYGPLGATRFFGTNMVMATGAAAAEQIWVNKDKAFANDGWELLIGPFFARGLMLLDFDEHRSHRQIMQQAFTPAALRSYFTRLDRLAAATIDHLAAGPLQLHPFFRELALRIAVDVFVHVPLDDDGYRRLAAEFATTERAGPALLRVRVPGSRYAKGFAGRRYLEQFFGSHVAAKRAAPAAADLFSQLCHARSDDGARFSDTDIINHMIFLLMAAYDTTQIALTQFGYRLATHPVWQDKVAAEVAALPEAVGYDDLAADHLPVTDRVLRESLRMCPPVTVTPRRAVKDTEVLGHYIPAGTRVTVPVLNNHRNETVWANPHTFDPDRFLPDRFRDIHRFGWAPFGGGAHKCLGVHFAMREIPLIYAHLLRRYTIVAPTGYEAPMDYSALPIPSDGLPVTLQPR